DRRDTKEDGMRTSTQISYTATTPLYRPGRVELLPQAMGRDAFWQGRPIWANPFAGDPARQWSAGWHSGVAELRARSGKEELPSPDDSSWQSLIKAHRC